LGELAQRIRGLLSARGLDWPAPIEDFETLASTNDTAKDRARTGAPQWTAILAGEQTRGRGRHGHDWLSTPGNLFVSVVLRPSLPALGVSLLPLAAGVAVAEAVGELGVVARLKWPNDVLAEGRKLAGILVEGSDLGETQPSVVVGVGVNLRLSLADVPPELRERVISIEAVTQRSAGVEVAAAAVLARLTVWYHALERDGVPAILAAWRRWSVDWWGERVAVRSGADVVRGVFLGIDERGALVLRADDGRELAFFSGEVSEIRRTPEGRPDRETG
jgi:BirA family biotin operon repressor/biotin-[acetyl-CoA-carboxylase] ligase